MRKCFFFFLISIFPCFYFLFYNNLCHNEMLTKGISSYILMVLNLQLKILKCIFHRIGERYFVRIFTVLIQHLCDTYGNSGTCNSELWWTSMKAPSTTKAIHSLTFGYNVGCFLMLLLFYIVKAHVKVPEWLLKWLSFP